MSILIEVTPNDFLVVALVFGGAIGLIVGNLFGLKS